MASEEEKYFTFHINHPKELAAFESIVSLDRVEGLKIYAYANNREFKAFLETGRAYTLEAHPGDLEGVECSDYANLRGVPAFDKWPTYEGYLNLLKHYQTTFPNLCRTFEIGKSVKGRSLMCLALTGDKPGPKARIAQLGALHGDEVIGTMVSFRMINELLTGYQSGDNESTAILDNTELWFVPFCNPDGTYRSGNNTVSGARRANANGADLNRTFPSLKRGTERPEEAETRVLKDFLTQNQFTLAADFHGGIAGYIYPYTCGAAQSHPDKAFFIEFGKHLSASTTGGIKVGTAMDICNYWAKNTLVDFYNIHANAKGYTFELGPKMIKESDFDKYWKKFKEMYKTFYLGSHTGISGLVTDAATGQGIPGVKVFVEKHDRNNTWVFSYPGGAYYRPIASGAYTVTFSHNDYQSKTVSDISVKNFEKTPLEVQLQRK